MMAGKLNRSDLYYRLKASRSRHLRCTTTARTYLLRRITSPESTPWEMGKQIAVIPSETIELWWVGPGLEMCVRLRSSLTVILLQGSTLRAPWSNYGPEQWTLSPLGLRKWNVNMSPVSPGDR